jgi:hypothetical protein
MGHSVIGPLREDLWLPFCGRLSRQFLLSLSQSFGRARNEKGARAMIYLKCDAKGCNHKEAVPAITEDLIGRPCAVCGESLLTRADFEQTQSLVMPIVDALISSGIVRFMKRGESGPLLRIGNHDGEFTVKVGRKP